MLSWHIRDGEVELKKLSILSFKSKVKKSFYWWMIEMSFLKINKLLINRVWLLVRNHAFECLHGALILKTDFLLHLYLSQGKWKSWLKYSAMYEMIQDLWQWNSTGSVDRIPIPSFSERVDQATETQGLV